jgi:tryptophan synthase beta chain
MKIPYKSYLSEDKLPTAWYNLRADMKTPPAPLLNPGTGKPAALEELYPVFCEELAKQELDNTTRYFDIPGPVLDFYRMYRPAPLIRAYYLEKPWIPQQRSIINTRAITRQGVISLTAQCHRCTMPKSRD